jgi:hypothetical protein
LIDPALPIQLATSGFGSRATSDKPTEQPPRRC